MTAIADTGAQMVVAGPWLPGSLGLQRNELIPVKMTMIRSVSGHVRVLGGILLNIAVTNASGCSPTAKYLDKS